MFPIIAYICLVTTILVVYVLFSVMLNLRTTGLGNKHDSDVRECNGKWALPTVVNR